MTSKLKLPGRWAGARRAGLGPARACAMGLAIASMVPGAMASGPFPALDRAALHARAPGRTGLQAAATAGSRIVAVGERGMVALSDDGGVHWRQAGQVPVGVTLTAVRFVDARQGWAVGHGGVILHTGDGGENWVRQADGRTLAQRALADAKAAASARPGDEAAASLLRAAELLVADGPDKPLLDVCFADARHGYVVGAYGMFFETRDGGKSWASRMERLENGKGFHLYAIRRHGENLYIAGEQGLLFRSTDGGGGFQRLATPYNGSWFGLDVLKDGAVVVAGLRGNAFYSRDRGQSWARIEGAAPASFVSVAALPDGAVLLANQAGQIGVSRAGGVFRKLDTPPLPPLSEARPLGGGAVLAVGVAGATRLPAMFYPEAEVEAEK